MLSSHYIRRLHAGQEEYMAPGAFADVSPKVSVAVTTYQHGPFIASCLDSILSQCTDFDFEIVIGEDGSDDDTRAHCIRYAQRYPDKIRLFLRNRKDTGLFHQGRFIKSLNGQLTRMSCRGEYIALCEGDDYWTDPYKLQKQVAFLDKSPDFNLVFHKTFILNQDTQEEDQLNINTPDITDRNDLISGNYIRTCSALFRAEGLQKVMKDPAIHYFCYGTPGDWLLFLTLAGDKKIKLLDEYSAAYRIHSGGTWSKVANKNIRYAYSLYCGFRYLELTFPKILFTRIFPQYTYYLGLLAEQSLAKKNYVGYVCNKLLLYVALCRYSFYNNKNLKN